MKTQSLHHNGMGHDVESQGSTISYKGGTKYLYNQHTGHLNDGRTMNFGRGPTKAGTTGDSVPNPTAKGGKINGGATVKSPGNPNKINVGGRLTKGNE